ncbi:hypothetical protein GCM10017673_37660 [Streptosporangium violaceochromogenes]|nr:hypothetical protein GCM10017673_37660 [Streptosporangium violaceochromogenes]
MTIAEANAIIRLLRHLLDPDNVIPAERAADDAAYLASRARRVLLAGPNPDQVGKWVEERAAKADAEPRWDDAIDWLLNSGYTDPDAITAFWGVAEGRWTREDADRGHIDGRSLTEIAKEAGDLHG